MKTRQRTQRRSVSLCLATIATLLLSLTGPIWREVKAAPIVPVMVTIISFTEIDDPDTAIVDGDGDYYARVKIGDFDAQDSSVIEAENGQPFWTFTRDVDAATATQNRYVYITIELWDEDGGLNGPDNQMDISPKAGQWTLRLLYDMTTLSWTSDSIADNARSAEGNGDTDRSRITFTISGSYDVSDNDHDGLLDRWETYGYDADGNGSIDIDLPAMGADPDHQDLFLELDIMPGVTITQADIQAIKAAFAVAPDYAGSYRNPDGERGINVHIDTGGFMDGGVLIGDNLGGGGLIATYPTCKLDTGFYKAKKENFNAIRDGIFRYGISATYDITAPGCDTDGDGKDDRGGQGEIGGNDFVEFNHDGAAIMHELGHNLNLRHGGDENVNCKPNYVSIMNYDNAFGIRQVGGGTIIDYSPPRITADGSVRGAAPLPRLQEDKLNDSIVLDSSDPVNQFVFTDPLGNKVLRPLNAQADWNNNAAADPSLPPISINSADSAGDPAICADAAHMATNSTLTGHDDWTAISVPFRQFGDSKDGPLHPETQREPTRAELLRLEEAIKVSTALTLVRADSTYGDTTATFTATLRGTTGAKPPVVGAVISFTLNGQAVCGVNGKPACPKTNPQGVATFVGAVSGTINAGNYPNAVVASFAGDEDNQASQGRGPLKVERRMLLIKAIDRTVGLRQPNPPTTPPAGCVAQQTVTSACWLQLTPGAAFVNGDDWGDLNLANLRFTYSRNYPTSNASETVGKVYKISATGFSSANYDLRFQQGNLIVVP